MTVEEVQNYDSMTGRRPGRHRERTGLVGLTATIVLALAAVLAGLVYLGEIPLWAAAISATIGIISPISVLLAGAHMASLDGHGD